MDLLRLETVHPTLVHLTLGLVPAMLVAYLVAAARKSERWTFVGDVLLAFAAVVTLATTAFGLVSNWVLDWPGGLGTWRWLHLAAGAATALLLLAMAAVRFKNRRTEPVAGGGIAAAAVVTAAFGAFTGWIGGEVLVYHSGMAVRAAANGGLAPPLGEESETPPNVHEAMEELRAAWAGAKTEIAGMVVEHPTPEAFERVAAHARRLEALGGWLTQQQGHGGHDHGDEEAGAPPQGDDHSHEQAAGPSQGDDHGDEQDGDHGDQTASAEQGHGGDAHGEEPPRARTGERGGEEENPFREEGAALRRHARALLEAAERQDIAAAADALGNTTSTCAHCHEETRWKK